jgi:hypothetical protein
MGIFHEYKWIFVTTSRSVLLRMIKTFQTKVVEEIKIHILRSIIYFFKKIVTFMTRCTKKAVQPDRLQMEIRRKCAACWLPQTTNTHSECVIIIVFPMQQRLQERASCCMLHVHCRHCSFFYKSDKLCFKLLVNAELS